ncbi:MAG TPA: hypothetical protein VJ826_14395 [Candidatus Polarisedimenticolaceae bacterium]|nr:hypothetical protein [Candidatus Polarisedimenticolaceae bacterium]
MRPKDIAAAIGVTLLATAASAADIGWNGWGPRVGISSDPDQFVAGAHFDLGEFTRNLRFQPSAEIGLGDDMVSFYGNAMTAYYFPVKGNVTPYAGAQLTAWLVDFDDEPGNNQPFDDEFDDGFNTEIGLAALGGIETRFKSGTRFLAELQVELTNHPEIKVMAGWTFGKGTPPPTSR